MKSSKLLAALLSLCLAFTALCEGAPEENAYEPAETAVCETAEAEDEAATEPAEPVSVDITQHCVIYSNTHGTRSLFDKKLNSFWTASPDGGNVTIEIPSWTQPGGLTVEWLKSFPGFELKEYGRDGALINTVDGADCFPAYITYLDLNSETAKIVISVPSGTRISEITVYSRGTYDGTRQRWLNPAEKADIMLIVAHQDDEELWFGGLLPYYDSVRGKNVQVVYMTDCGRPRVREALNGLWVMGMRTLPEVIGFEDDYSTVKDSIKLWGGESRIEYELVRVIRLFKPEVIVTHDINGEYGHPQHRLTAQMMERAIAVAADPDKYPDLTKRYGAWEVKKLYLHLGDTNVIYMNWDEPSEALGGKTPLEVACLGYLEHVSQQSRYSMSQGKIFDYTKYSLIYSTVGNDVLKNDFLENTSAAD